MEKKIGHPGPTLSKKLFEILVTSKKLNLFIYFLFNIKLFGGFRNSFYAFPAQVINKKFWLDIDIDNNISLWFYTRPLMGVDHRISCPRPQNQGCPIILWKIVGKGGSCKTFLPEAPEVCQQPWFYLTAIVVMPANYSRTFPINQASVNQ